MIDWSAASDVSPQVLILTVAAVSVVTKAWRPWSRSFFPTIWSIVYVPSLCAEPETVMLSPATSVRHCLLLVKLD